MSLSGTDLMALACIAGSATLGGVATVAAVGADGPEGMACATVSAPGTHRIVVLRDGRAGTVFLSPDVRLEVPGGCGPAMAHEIEVRLEPARLRKEIELRLQRELERVQVELESRQTELQGRQTELEARQQELQARKQELQALQEALHKR